MLLMVDNYDSFTYNVVQYFGELKTDVKVVRNDEVSVEAIAKENPEYVVISPGPCTPSKAGISMSAVDYFSGKVPVLGICLGHQSIGEVFGGQTVRASKVMHGKVSPVYHNNVGVFAGLPSPFNATRYHSLVTDKNTLPDCLEITAWTQNDDGSMDEIMGVKHRELEVEGVQFHPESILTEHGHQLLDNFLTTYRSR
jgi:anthranilate synthase component 2